MYLYSGDHTVTLTNKPATKQHLIYLGNTKDFQQGKPGDMTTLANWGNPFFDKYLHGELPIFYSTKKPSEMNTDYKKTT